MGYEFLKPSPRSLFKAIEGLVEFADMVGKMRINKSRGLSHIHFFFKCAMEKSMLRIKLFNNPSKGSNES